MAKFNTILCFLFLFMIFLPKTLLADQPSKSETIEFIKSKCNLSFSEGGIRTQDIFLENSQQQFDVTGCFLVIKITGYVNSGTYVSIYRIPLNKMDPTRVVNFPAAVQLYAKEEKEVIEERNEFTRPKENSTFFRSSEPILVLPPYDSNVDKVNRALRHLIKLCGGTGELF